MRLALFAHDDDCELFAAFTAIRERPLCVVCLDSYVQPGRGIPDTDRVTRARETVYGLCQLSPVLEHVRLEIRDDAGDMRMRSALVAKLQRFDPARVWAPAIERGGHPHHNLVGEVAATLWPSRVTHYLSYTNRGKSTDGLEVLPEDGDWIARKLRALACHKSQMTLDPRCGCWPHFLGEFREFYQR